MEEILHFDIHQKKEIVGGNPDILDPSRPATIGITAGASCPNNLIEETMVKVLQMRGESYASLIEERP